MRDTGSARRPWVPACAAGVAVLLLAVAGAAFESRAVASPVVTAVVPGFGNSKSIPYSPALGAPRFGTSVALSSDGAVALVGAPNDNPGSGPTQPAFGAAWISTRSATTWQPGPKLTPGKDRGDFGTAVALSGDGRVAVVGAPRYNGDKGAIWMYTSPNRSTWVGRKITVGNISGAGKFGSSVAISTDGTTVLVGGPDDNKKVGAVWVFRRAGQQLQLVTTLRPTGTYIREGRFGTSVALSADGRVALVGAPGYLSNSGRVYPYANFGLGWRAQDGAKLGGAKSDGYGADVALSADGATALVGQPGRRAASLHRRSGSTWSLGTGIYRQAEYGEPPDLWPSVGSRVAMSPDARRLFVSARSRSQAKAVFVFDMTSALTPQVLPGQSTGFGADIATSADGQVVLVGSSSDKGAAFAYVDPPGVSGVVPALGPSSGGTPVTITGDQFSRVRAVRFGDVPAASFTVRSTTEIAAVSPPGTGNVFVTVVTARGTTGTHNRARFFYIPAPALTGIGPASGPAAGGTQVTLTGTNLVGATAVRFGTTAATSFAVRSETQIDAVSPPGVGGTVPVTVTTNGGTSAVTTAAQFTYVAAPTETTITFDELTTGGPGASAGALTTVSTQYASRGVTFNDVKAIDYSKDPGAIPGFARSGTIGIEQCVGVEFCQSPIRATFAPPQRVVRLSVGFSFRLNEPLQVRLTAYAGESTVGTATATLPANPSPTPIRTQLEVVAGSASITRIEVAVPGGYNNALAVDHLVFSAS